jgi:predicted dehydrogenase
MNSPVTVDFASTDSKFQPLRVGVIGGGHLGRIHAKLLSARSDVQCVAVCDPVEASRQWIESQLSLPTCPSYHELVGKIDAAVIATPTTLHHEHAQWCLEHGVHVLIEKPIAQSVEQADALQSLAQIRQCTLQVGHVERFNPVWTALNERMDRATVRHIESRREGVYTGRSTDIGIVLDLMIHDIDLILSLVPSPIQSIRATGRCVLGAHEDFAIADLVFRNGVTAHLRASRISSSAVRSMEVHCEEEWFVCDFSSNLLTSTCASDAVASGEILADRLPADERARVKDELFSRWLHQSEVRPAACNAIECEHSDFVEAIRMGREPRVSGRDGARALRVACTITEQIEAQLSAQRGVIPATRLAAARRKAG